MIYSWSGQEQNELDQLFKDLNKKYLFIKFDYKASKVRIVILDTEIYLHNGKLHTEIYRKETDRQHYGRMHARKIRQNTSVITYNRFLPNIIKTIRKNWNILQMNESLKEIFKNKPITHLHETKTSKKLLGHIG